jgi:hypothetical protein
MGVFIVTNDTHIEHLLSRCSTLFDKRPDVADRLTAVIRNPTEQTWDDSYNIILNCKNRTCSLWQAVIAVDPTFPKTGPVNNQKGERLEGWKRIPDSLLIVNAIAPDEG